MTSIAATSLPNRRNVVLLQSGDMRKPTFCVHASDGDVVSYLQLARELHGAAQTYGITALDLDLKTVLPGSVHDIAEYYSEQVRLIPRHGPIRLVGWSSGAWIAFEMANTLQRHGEVIDSLTVLDAPPPDPNELTFDLPKNVLALGLTSDTETSASCWWRFLCTYTSVERDASGIPANFWRLSDDAKCSFLFEHVLHGDMFKAFNTLLAATDAGDIMYMFNILNSQYEAFRRYEGSSFGGRINLFVSLRAGATEPQIAHRLNLLESYWSGRTSVGELRSYPIVGDHSAPLYPPVVQEVAKVILE
jgi:pimeloyl-ACP methyl ester carboxylesterase